MQKTNKRFASLSEFLPGMARVSLTASWIRRWTTAAKMSNSTTKPAIDSLSDWTTSCTSEATKRREYRNNWIAFIIIIVFSLIALCFSLLIMFVSQKGRILFLFFLNIPGALSDCIIFCTCRGVISRLLRRLQKGKCWGGLRNSSTLLPKSHIKNRDIESHSVLWRGGVDKYLSVPLDSELVNRTPTQTGIVLFCCWI